MRGSSQRDTDQVAPRWVCPLPHCPLTCPRTPLVPTALALDFECGISSGVLSSRDLKHPPCTTHPHIVPCPSDRVGYCGQASEMTKFNEDLDRAITLFAHFIRCYKDDRCKDPLVHVVKCRPAIVGDSLPGATSLDDGSRWVQSVPLTLLTIQLPLPVRCHK